MSLEHRDAAPLSASNANTTAVAGLRGATKIFGGTTALSGVSFSLHAGEVLALLGENGAGKSTCVKLLAGVYHPTEGTVVLGGNPVSFATPLNAQHRGIAVMHQHPGLFGDLSVVENIYLGHQHRINGHLDHSRMRRDAVQLLETVGLSCSPDQRLNRLRTSEQQLVEVARALSLDAQVLIMDEPTAALSQREVERLFAVVEDLKARQVAMMFVGHRMEEIFRISDRVAVLRDGQLVATETTASLTRERAVQLMVGRPLNTMFPERHHAHGDVVLAAHDLSRGDSFQDVSFEVRSGEILGLGGLVGSGRTEIARVLFGIDQPTTGDVRIDNRSGIFSSPREAMDAGIAYVSEDRMGQSLIMDFGILNNASLPVIDSATRAGLVHRDSELALVKPQLERMRLRFQSFDQPVQTLSGGNQQKVVLAKWLATKPRILILDEPTQGIDVNTKAEVHSMIASLARQGMAIILISSELPELLGMCHRIIVLREGRVTAEYSGEEATQELVMHAATDASTPIVAARSSSPTPAAGIAPAPLHAVDVLAEPSRRAPSTPKWLSAIQGIVVRREFGLLCSMFAIIIPISIINPRMLSGANVTALSMDAGLLMIVAISQMLVILTRNIDLSIASVIGLSAYVAASSLHAHPDMGIFVALALSCAVGVACGLANGLIVAYGKVPSIVATLGTLAVFRGANSLWAGGKQISADQVPAAWLDMTSIKILGVPSVVMISLVTCAVFALGLRWLSIGREVYAVGSNPAGAALIGIPVKRRILGAFVLSGLLAGFDGALWASRYATVDARVALGYEFTTVAAVVVGGVALRGGAGTLLGVLFGALTLLVIRNGLTLVRVDPLWLQGIYGLVIIAAISVDAFVQWRSSKHLARRSVR
jgi:ABC-type sugar transport system ATPase subunit/ribose/xylose/arabinose/galactoside ABC-type transport system permease subunit